MTFDLLNCSEMQLNNRSYTLLYVSYVHSACVLCTSESCIHGSISPPPLITVPFSPLPPLPFYPSLARLASSTLQVFHSQAQRLVSFAKTLANVAPVATAQAYLRPWAVNRLTSKRLDNPFFSQQQLGYCSLSTTVPGQGPIFPRRFSPRCSYPLSLLTAHYWAIHTFYSLASPSLSYFQRLFGEWKIYLSPLQPAIVFSSTLPTAAPFGHLHLPANQAAKAFRLVHGGPFTASPHDNLPVYALSIWT